LLLNHLVLLLILVVSAVHTLEKSELEYKTLWQQFLLDFPKKTYSTDLEELNRYDIFKSNVDIIDTLNEQFNPETRFGINQFADWSRDEYKRFTSGSLPRNMKKAFRPDPEEEERINSLYRDVDEHRVPESVDWRTKGAVTPIYDQGQCGSSPYFAAVTSIEGAWAIAGNELVTLSVQQIIDCTDDDSWSNQGCNGGYMDVSIEYVTTVGIETNKSYPYTGIEGTKCAFDAAKVQAKISGVVNVSVDETAVMAAVALVPVATAVDASSTAFEFYKSGIFNGDPSCNYPDHGIAIIGYGADAKGTKYWILKNSWTTDWGMEGFMWFTRNGKNVCGLLSYVSYATA